MTTNLSINDIDIEKFNEMVELLEPLKELLGSKEPMSNIKGIRYTDVTTKSFKVDTKVLNDWIKFCKENKGYKMQDLTTLALKEFMIRHRD